MNSDTTNYIDGIFEDVVSVQCDEEYHVEDDPDTTSFTTECLDTKLWSNNYDCTGEFIRVHFQNVRSKLCYIYHKIPLNLYQISFVACSFLSNCSCHSTFPNDIFISLEIGPVIYHSFTKYISSILSTTDD